MILCVVIFISDSADGVTAIFELGWKAHLLQKQAHLAQLVLQEAHLAHLLLQQAHLAQVVLQQAHLAHLLLQEVAHLACGECNKDSPRAYLLIKVWN